MKKMMTKTGSSLPEFYSFVCLGMGQVNRNKRYAIYYLFVIASSWESSSLIWIAKVVFTDRTHDNNIDETVNVNGGIHRLSCANDIQLPKVCHADG